MTTCPLNNPSGLHVIETYDDVYLGRLEEHGNELHVFTGFAGRPVVLDRTDIIAVTPAETHPDVEEVKR